MAVSAARATAFEILLRVEREDSYAAELLHSAALRKVSARNLSARDHGLTTELVMGVLRWRALLDRRVAASSSLKIERMDIEVLTALRLGAYQLLFLSRVPARAAIFESVELVKAARKRSAAPLVNAVLRKVGVAGAGDFFGEIESATDADGLALAAAHPRWLVERWVGRHGLETARGICGYDQRVPETAIHIDSRCQEDVAGVELAPGRLLTRARLVVSGDVTETRAYREGRVGIQDEGSQLVALLAAANVDGAILDCCAAPGSKTGLMARRNPAARVVATEVHPHRARLLRALCRAENVFVVAADARALPFNSGGFDRVLADVPCSGTGTLGRNPEIRWRLREEDLQDLQARQIAILKSALEQLAVGGRLVYSTCSLEREENEAVVEAALGAGFEGVDCRGELELLGAAGEIAGGVEVGSLVDSGYLRTIPGVHGCDGFFAAVIGRR
ncbi:MAG TPA: transcription antitermination factor NusB [Terriglobales bacterium]|nr:transcription antitermination factor NusB [Terriglobales bacterium]